MSLVNDVQNVWHAGTSIVHHLTSRRASRKMNARLTRSIIRICEQDPAQVTNQILFGTLQCRFLEMLMTQHGFLSKQLIRLARTQNVVYPWSLEYDALRMQANKRFQFFPLMIAFPETEHEVVLFVRLAIKHRMALSIRAGGHSSEGTASAGELVLDLSLLQLAHFRHSECIDGQKLPAAQIEIDTVNNTLRMSPGVHLGRFYTELIKRQRICSAGTCPNVAGGIVIGGGLGTFDRKLGLSCDDALQFRIVLADGSIVVADKDSEQHRDLFRALRGGGNANFGVITEISMRIFPVAPVLVYFNLVWKATEPGVEHIVAQWHNRFVQKAPPSVTTTELRMTSGIDEVTINGFFWLSATKEQSSKKNKKLLCRASKTALKQVLQQFWFEELQVNVRPLRQTIECVSPQRAVEIASGGDAQAQPFFKARSFFAQHKIKAEGWRKILTFVATNQPFPDIADGKSVVLFHGFGRESVVNGAGDAGKQAKLLNTTVFPTRSSISWQLNYTFWRLQSQECQALAFSQRLNDVIRPFLSNLSYYNWQDNQLLLQGDQKYLDDYFDDHGHVALLKTVKQRYDPKGVFSYALGVSQVGQAGTSVPVTSCGDQL